MSTAETKPAAKPAEPTPAAKPAPAATPPTETRVPRSALELRAARRRTLQRRYGIFVGVPTLLAIIYYLLIATPQYDSYMTLAVESNEGRTGDKTPNAGNLRDARLLAEALRGAPALAALDQGGAFRAHYGDNGDWTTRLSSKGADATLAYFRDKISITQEPNTNIETIRVRAFTGEAAHDHATKLLGFAQTWIHQQNETSSAARLNQAQQTVAKERAALTKAAEALAGVTQPTSTDPVVIEHQLAEKRLEVGLKGYQEALLDVGRAERYLVVVDGPSQPDEPSLPRRGWGILSVCVAAIVLVSVLSLLGSAVREHAKF